MSESSNKSNVVSLKKGFNLILMTLFLTLMMSSFVSAVNLTTNNTLYYSFDGATLTNDTYDGTPDGIDGVLNGAINLDGAGETITISTTPDISASTDKTIGFWIYIDTLTDTNEYVFDTTDRFIISPKQGATNTWAVYNGTHWNNLGNTSHTTTGVWRHVVFTFGNSGSNLSMYINGSYIASSDTFGGNSFGSIKVIGDAFSKAGSSDLDGKLDEFFILNKSLSQSEITSLYQGGSPTTQANETITSNVVYYNSMDALYDLSGNANYGTQGATGMVHNEDGKINGAWDFDGTADYIVTPVDTALDVQGNDDFSISLWVKGEASMTTNRLLGTTTTDGFYTYQYWYAMNDDAVSCNETGSIKWELESSSGANARVCSGITVFDGNWHHVVFVLNGSNDDGGLYIDGVDQSYVFSGSYATLGTADMSDGKWTLGLIDPSDSSGTEFDGLMDEVAFYTKALNSTEISELYNSGTGFNPYAPGPTPSGINLTINLTSPANNSQVNQGAVTFEYETFGNTTIDNCSLYLNGGLTSTNYDNSSFTIVMPPNNYTWYVTCENTEGSATSNTFNLEVEADYIDITIISPINNTSYIVNTLNFTYNATSNVQIDTCSLYINDTLNTTDSILVDYFTITNISDGNHSWYISCNTSNVVENSSVYYFFVDVSSPLISTNFVNLSDAYTRLDGQFNFSDNILLHSLNISIDGLTIYSNESIDNPTFNYTLDFDTTTISPGEKNLVVRIADGHTAHTIKDYGVDHDWLDNGIKYVFDEGWLSVNPEGLTGKLSTHKEKDRYTFEYDKGWNEDLTEKNFYVRSSHRISVIRESKYAGHLVVDDLDKWIDFEEIDGAKVTVTRINDKEMLINVKPSNNDKDKLKFKSIGDLNVVTQNYTIFILNATESYATDIINDEEATYTLDLYHINGTIRTVILNLNGTNYTSTLNTSNSTYQSNYVTRTISETFSDNVQYPHQWFFNLSNGTFVNTSIVYQTLWDVNFGVCNASLTFPVLNFTFQDETTSSSINVDFTYDMTVSDDLTSELFESGTTNVSSLTFCTNIDPNNLTYTWNVSGIFTLDKTGYVTRVYSLDAIPFEVSNNPMVTKILYMIKTNESSTINYRWYSKYLQIIDGTLLIYRCEVNESILVESTPIISASASANIELLTQAYFYKVIVNGQTYEDSNTYSRCHVESRTDPNPYYVDLGEEVNTVSTFGLYQSNCNIAFTSNTTAAMSWGDNPESSETITGCLLGYRDTISGSVEVFSNCSTTSPIDVTLVNNGNNYVLKGILEQGNTSVLCGNNLVVTPETFGDTLFGMSGLLAGIFLIITFALFFVSRAESSLIAVGFTLIICILTGLFGAYFDISIGLTMIAILLIVAVVGRYTRK